MNHHVKVESIIQERCVYRRRLCWCAIGLTEPCGNQGYGEAMSSTACGSLWQSAKWTRNFSSNENEWKSKNTLKHRVDGLESSVNLIADLGSREHNLTTHKDQQHNLRFDHAVNQARKQLRLIRAKVVMARSKTLETNRKLDVARPDNVLNLEVRELSVEPELLDDARVLARGKLAVVLALCAGHHHLARSEDECRGLGLTNAHNDGSETLIAQALLAQAFRTLGATPKCKMYLWVVLGIAGVQRNRLEVQTTVEVDGCDNVP